jgi:protein-serine/threonine kinase
MRKLTKKLFSTISSERKITATEQDVARETQLQEPRDSKPAAIAALLSADSDDESPTTSLRKVPSLFTKPLQINTNNSSYPRYLPSEIPSEGFLHFVRMPTFGTSMDYDNKPYTVYCLEVRSTLTMPFTWTVYRRFSHFCRLRQSLHDCEGIKVPELPPRPHEYSHDQTINRKRQLEEWLHSLIEMHLKTPGMEPLIHNAHVRRFLTENFNVEPAAFTHRYSSPRQIPSNHSLLSTPASPGGSKVSIHDFNVVTTIGKGAFGQVFLVKSKRDATQLYAMKSFRRKDMKRDRQYDIIEKERKIMEGLHCPFIVEMHFVLKTKESLFFILDYCAGGELLFHLSRLGRFPERTAKFYCAELCLALEYLHERDIMYRDLKPENILLSAHGHVKLVDFGLAKGHVSSHISGARTYCGTEQYLAPEVLDRQDYGKAVDWWALGMILYEMLTGLPPWYDAENQQEVFAGIRYGVLKFPRYISRLSAVMVQALLCREPHRRLGSGSGGTSDVKEHAYFHDIDWIDLAELQIPPPILPCASPHDVHSAKNFEEEFKRMSVDAFCHWDELVDEPDEGDALPPTKTRLQPTKEQSDETDEDSVDPDVEPAARSSDASLMHPSSVSRHSSWDQDAAKEIIKTAHATSLERRGLFLPSTTTAVASEVSRPAFAHPIAVVPSPHSTAPSMSSASSPASEATSLPSSSSSTSISSDASFAMSSAASSLPGSSKKSYLTYGLEPRSLQTTPLFSSSRKTVATMTLPTPAAVSHHDVHEEDDIVEHESREVPPSSTASLVDSLDDEASQIKIQYHASTSGHPVSLAGQLKQYKSQQELLPRSEMNNDEVLSSGVPKTKPSGAIQHSFRQFLRLA